MTRVAAVVVLLGVVAVFLGPALYVEATGHPLVDCVGLEPSVCDEVWRERAQGDDSTGPIVMVRVEPSPLVPSPRCSAVTISRWWIFPIVGGSYSSPLC